MGELWPWEKTMKTSVQKNQKGRLVRWRRGSLAEEDTFVYISLWHEHKPLTHV